MREVKSADQALEVAHSAENKAAQALEVAHSAENKAAQALEIGEDALIALNAILSSRSWRVTAPLRLMKSEYKKINRVRMRISVKKLAKIVMIKIVKFVLKRKKIKKLILKVIPKFGITNKLKRVYSEEVMRSSDRLNLIVNEIKDGNVITNETKIDLGLSVHSQKIYLKIKKAIEERR
jgi:hypothetical protein